MLELESEKAISAPEPRPKTPSAMARPRLILLILGCGLALRFAVAWQPFNYQLWRGPLIDDAFYSLNIARHLALGQGFTTDGLHSTNGFQPLYVFLMVPLYWVWPEDRIAPLYAAMTFLAMVNIATGWVIYRLIRRQWGDPAALFGLLIFCFSPYIIDQSLNGLETALTGLGWMLTLDLYWSRVRPDGGTLRSRLTLALVLALTVFTRVDGAILAVAVALDFLFRPVDKSLAFTRRLRLISQIALFSLLLYSPWAAWNLPRFGQLLPGSGAAVRDISQIAITQLRPEASSSFLPLTLAKFCWQVTGIDLSEDVLFFPAAPLSLGLRIIGKFTHHPFLDAWWLGLIFFILGLTWSRLTERKMDALFIAIALLLAAYNFYLQGFWYFSRYFFPLQLGLLLLGCGLFHFLAQKIPAWSRRPALVILIILYLPLVALGAWSRFGIKDKDGFNIIHYYEMAKYIDEKLPASARIGSFQSGVIGYFSKHTVINLDGVVNSEVLTYSRENKLMNYFRRNGIEYVVTFNYQGDSVHLLTSVLPGDLKYLSITWPPQSDIQVYHVLNPSNPSTRPDEH